jgi:hypothetical protein
MPARRERDHVDVTPRSERGRLPADAGRLSGLLDKGLAHFAEKGTDLDEIVETRLYPDMQPFRFQVQSVAHHSLGAIRR